jgi:hypothetical protein
MRGDFNARSDADEHTIVTNFLGVFDALIRSIEDPAKKIAGIAFAFPGDFDWKAWSIPRSLLRKIYHH